MIKVTWNRLQTCLNAALAYLAQNEKKTKLHYALERTKVKIEKLNETLQNLLEDIVADTYAVDTEGVLLTDDKGRFRLTKAGLADRTKRQRDLMGTEIDFDPYFATAIPEDLTESQISAFEGIVIKQEDADRVRKAQEEKYLQAADKTAENE